MSLPRAAMRLDMSALVTDWGVSCSIRRRGQTRNTAGQISAAFASVATELLWIQPVDSRVYRMGAVEDPGLKDGMYFEYFQHYAGSALQAGDQVVAVGQTYVYDVLAVQLLDNHRHGFLHQVKRA